MQRGVRLSLDVGSVRIGVAACDADGLMAYPLATIDYGSESVTEILALILEHQAIAVYVGNPVNLSGATTKSTTAAAEFATQLAQALTQGITVRLIDERLSTVSAQRGLHEAGRNTKNSKSIIDQAAAVVILEHALESEKRQGDFVGQIVESIRE